MLERREKTGTDLHTDRKDEKNQAELLNEMTHLTGNTHTEMRGDDADEQNPGNTERDAENLDFSQQNTHGNHQGQREYSVGYSAADK